MKLMMHKWFEFFMNDVFKQLWFFLLWHQKLYSNFWKVNLLPITCHITSKIVYRVDTPSHKGLSHKNFYILHLFIFLGILLESKMDMSPLFRSVTILEFSIPDLCCKNYSIKFYLKAYGIILSCLSFRFWHL